MAKTTAPEPLLMTATLTADTPIDTRPRYKFGPICEKCGRPHYYTKTEIFEGADATMSVGFAEVP